MRRFIYLFFLLLFIASAAVAQPETPTGSSKYAKGNFALGNYKAALDEYLLLIKNDSNNLTYNFRIGECYLYTNIDKSKAVYFLEKATLNPKVDPSAWYELGSAYLATYSFDEAIESLEKYAELANGKEGFEISSERMIQMCEEAKLQTAHPVNVTVECMGPEINSAYPDYNAYIPSDESFLVYTSKRAGNTGNLEDYDGYTTADVYISYLKYNKWSKAKTIGNTINSELVEETAGMTTDGSKLYLYVDNYNAMGQVMLTERKGKTFQKPVFLGDNISLIKLVTSAVLSPDKKMLVISCNLNEDAGGLDLYVSHKLPSGNWSPPDNIGPEINTVYNEDYPYFSADGKTLYFCSQGHNSMGGYDLFKSYYDAANNTWSEPVNLGYPVNTPDDDMTISLSASGRHGYISSLRPGGRGNLDIYKVIFNDVDPAYMVFSGGLVNKDSVNIFKVVAKTIDTVKIDTLKKVTLSTGLKQANDSLKTKDTATIKKIIKPEIKVDITVTDKSTQKIFGKYLPNRASGKFLIILPPGEFEIAVTADGYEKYNENLRVFERASTTEINRDIVLQPAITGINIEPIPH